MQKLLITCKTNDEIKYGVCVEDGLKLNDNALELEVTNEELNMLVDGLVEFRDKINAMNEVNKTSETVHLESDTYNKDNPHHHYLKQPNHVISKEIVGAYVRGIIDETNNALEINKILKIKKLEKLEEEYYNLNDKLEKTKAFLDILEKQLF